MISGIFSSNQYLFKKKTFKVIAREQEFSMIHTLSYKSYKALSINFIFSNQLYNTG